jgi:predicted phage baseplate assembly protein
VSSSGACPCDKPPEPQVVSNPPGQSVLSYRVDDFSGFRRALLEPRAGEQALAGWRPAAGDLGLQVLEWWAYLADILTFYNERIANEDYLRTAQLPASVTRLVELIGYRPRPAIAATGALAAIRRGGHPNEPLVIARGMPVANVATPGVGVETFEVGSEASFEGASDVDVVLAPGPALLGPARAPGAIGSVLLAGRVTGLKAGEELLLLSRTWTAPQQHWAKVAVVSSAPETDPHGASNTRVELVAAQASEVQHWMTGAAAADYRLLRPAQSASLWTQTALADTLSETKDGSGLHVRLSAAVRGIAAGDFVFFDAAAGTAFGLVKDTTEAVLGIPYPGAAQDTPAPPDIPVTHTVLTTVTPYAAWVAEHLAPAKAVTLRFGLKDVGALVGTPAQTLESLPQHVDLPSGFTVPPGGTTAFLEDATGAGIAVLVTASAKGTMTLAATPASPTTPATPGTFALTAPLRLLVDLVGVSRGTTVAAEALGTGDASVPSQTFTLKKSPLTYLASGGSSASTLRIAVDGLFWTEVETFFGQPAGARVFVVTQLPDATSQVRFGDGVNGARLPTGGLLVASYRYGAGAPSPPAGRLTTILRPQPNLASVRNPVAVWGGADAEQPSAVRDDAPASVLTFGRAISADDYETVAARAPGVTRARARWTWDAGSQRTLVKVYVGDDAGAVTSASNALSGAEDPNRPVAVVQASAIALTLTCSLAIAADREPDGVLAAASAALADLFAAARMAIGETLFSSAIEAALLVDGAVAVHGLTVAGGDSGFFHAGALLGGLSHRVVRYWMPDEGAFFTLEASTITPVTSDG